MTSLDTHHRRARDAAGDTRTPEGATARGRRHSGESRPSSTSRTADRFEVDREAFLRLVDPVLVTEPSAGAVVDANPAACALFGFSIDELLTIECGEVRDLNDGRWLAAVARRDRTGAFRGELSCRRSDGSTFSAEVASSLFEVAGHTYAVISFHAVLAAAGGHLFDRTAGSDPLGNASPADLAILDLLPTPLSFLDMAELVGESPEIVRARAIALYRQLGASSRVEAITRAHSLGLLDSIGPLDD